jgi:hypothetical protein
MNGGPLDTTVSGLQSHGIVVRLSDRFWPKAAAQNLQLFQFERPLLVKADARLPLGNTHRKPLRGGVFYQYGRIVDLIIL